MSELYKISYEAHNRYEHQVFEAYWQFLIIPEKNKTQSDIQILFEKSIPGHWEYSQNGQGFTTIRVRSVNPFTEVQFKADFELKKKKVNPFDFQPSERTYTEESLYNSLSFIVDNEPFLRKTKLTSSKKPARELYQFDENTSVFENLMQLNTWVFHHINYTSGVTHTDTTLDEVLDMQQGVCQDFAHLFCYISRAYSIPTRYVSGYLHQGHGHFGDAQMHAWVESFIPGIGWIGFDPTNKILTATDHIKVCHGKDYSDCAPIKGIVYSSGGNATQHKVVVNSQQ